MVSSRMRPRWRRWGLGIVAIGVLLFIGLTVVPSDPQEPTAEDHQWAAAHGPIRIAAGPTAPPAYIADEDGELTGGHLIELISLAATRAAVQIEYIPYPDVGAAVAAVVDGEADMVIAAERPDIVAAGLEATTPFGWPPLSVLAIDPTIETLEDLTGRRIATAPGSPLEVMLNERLPQVDYVETVNIPEGFDLFLSGEIDAYFGSLDMISYFLQESFTTTHIVGEPLAVIPAGLYAPAGSPQLRLMEHGRRHITEDELLQAQLRWAGVDLTKPDDTPVDPVLVTSLVFIAVLGLVMLGKWQRNHRRQLDILRTQDPLTGMLNRNGLIEAVRTAVTTPEDRWFAVCYVDLDGFKDVNDSYGHASGDQILISTANRLRAELRQTDVVARLGGDEFAAVINDLNPDSAFTVLERITSRWLETLAQPTPTKTGVAAVTASIGVVLGQTGDSPEWLIARADRAMYQAKHAGKSRSEIYGRPAGHEPAGTPEPATF